MNVIQPHLMNEQQVAEMLGVSRAWLQQMRVKGGGPRFYKIGGAVRYDNEQIKAWIAARECKSTSAKSYKEAVKTVERSPAIQRRALNPE